MNSTKNFKWLSVILLNVFLLLLSCTKKPLSCPKEATFEKIKGISSKILEKPMDKIKIKLGKRDFILMINKNFELILQQEYAQQVLFDLKIPDGRKAYFAELDWAGDKNQDCQVDLVVWKKLGVYLGKHEIATESHSENRDEKFYFESQSGKDLPYAKQSLGKY